MTIGRNDGHAYLAAMEREAGAAGRMLGWGVLEGRVPPLWEIRPTEFPLAAEVLDRATGVIVHSRYVETQAREHGYDGLLWRIPHPAWPAPELEPAPIEGSPLFGCFGHLNESKRIPQVLRAFAEFRAEHPSARLLLVGAEAPGFDLAGRLERLGLDSEGVIREPYVEEERLWALMAACDACVLLRAPTMGETSGSAIRTLSLGKPLVVSDLGWFAELPDEVALKVPVGEGEVDGLVAAMRRLAEPGVAARMGEAARAYVRAEHDLDRVAEQYVAALEQVAGSGAVEAKILRAVAEAAADTGVEPARIAPELAALGLVSSNGNALVQRRVWPRFAGPAPGVARRAVRGRRHGTARARPTRRLAVDHGRRARLLRHGAKLRGHGHFLIRGVHANYGFVYPLLLSPAYKLFGSMIDVYHWARVINALVMCSVVFPTYLLARRVVRPGFALAAAALAVALPSTIYIGTLMTENAFYPDLHVARYALMLALEQPTLKRQLVLLALCALAFLTRAQAVALFAAVLTAPLALAWIERGRPRRLRAWKPTTRSSALPPLLVFVVEVARGRSPAQILGGYSVTTTGASYRCGRRFAGSSTTWLRSTSRSSCFPLRRLSCSSRTPATSTAVAGVLRCGCSAHRLADDRGRRLRLPLVSANRGAQPLLRRAALPDRAPRVDRARPTAALTRDCRGRRRGGCASRSDPVRRADEHQLSIRHAVSAAVVVSRRPSGRRRQRRAPCRVASVLLSAAFLWLPRRYAPVLPALVALGFLLTWLPLQLWIHSLPAASAAAYATGVSAPRAWVDNAVGRNADVTLVFTGANPYRGWENEFWNRSIHRVYDLGAPSLISGHVRTARHGAALHGNPAGSRGAARARAVRPCRPLVPDCRRQGRRGSRPAHGGLSRRRAAADLDVDQRLVWGHVDRAARRLDEARMLRRSAARSGAQQPRALRRRYPAHCRLG